MPNPQVNLDRGYYDKNFVVASRPRGGVFICGFRVSEYRLHIVAVTPGHLGSDSRWRSEPLFAGTVIATRSVAQRGVTHSA